MTPLIWIQKLEWLIKESPSTCKKRIKEGLIYPTPSSNYRRCALNLNNLNLIPDPPVGLCRFTHCGFHQNLMVLGMIAFDICYLKCR